MKQPIFALLAIGMLFFAAACAGPGERIPISLTYQEETAPAAKQTSPGKVVVFPFQDKREQNKPKDARMIGRRTHLFGQIDTFESPTPVGQKVAEILVAALRERGWDARIAAAEETPQQVAADRVITGTIEFLWAEATSHFGYTEIDTRLTLHLEIQDQKSGVKTTFKINDENDPKVVFFSPEKLQKTVDELISEGVRRIPA